MGVQAAFLPDDRRLHLHHGPIDLIIDAEGRGRDRALRAARQRFETILDELVPELDHLRSPVTDMHNVKGVIAQRMQAAATVFAPDFVTPMVAVAGSVADTVLTAITAAGPLRRAYVNNGGDIALHLTGTEQFRAAIANGRLDRVRIDAHSPVRGIATSGWRGRSQSFGIADSVTVLASTAAGADAAATLIANAVDLPESPKVSRRPASDLFPDSDLGDRLVTTDVALLTRDEIDLALMNGHRFARTCLSRGLIHAAHLTLGGETISVGTPLETLKDLTHA